MQALENTIKCKSRRLLIVNLGLPIGAKRSLRHYNIRSLINLKRNYLSCKKLCLSFGGKIILVKACLSNLQVYYIYIFGMPKVVIERLD